MKVDRLQNMIADATIFFMAIIIIICGLNSTNFTYFGTNILTDLVDNWKKRPITDIIKGYGSCPASYESLYEDIWPGTVRGCLNSNGSFGIGSCTNKNSKIGTTIPPISRVIIHYWEGALLCAKKHDKDYFYFSEQNIRMGCGLGDKICGRLDSLGKTYCVKANEECFINNIIINTEISNNSNPSNTIPLDHGKYLKFSKGESSGGEIIIDLKPSFGEVCIDPLEKNINFTPYPLLDQSKIKFKCSNNVSDTFYDSRYKKLDQSDLNDYYESNKVSPLLNSLPKYKSPPLDTKIGLYTRGYLGWKESCVKDEFASPKNIKDSLGKLNQLNFYQSAISLTSLIYFLLMSGLLIFKIKYVLLNADDVSAEENIMLADMINFVGIMIGLIFVILAYSTGSGLVNFFMALRDLECGDRITNQILFSFADELNTNISKNVTIVVIYIITIILIPLNLIVMNYRSRNYSYMDMETYALLSTEEKNLDN